MKTLNFTLNSTKNGGHITAFNYSHSLNELVGSWSASVAGGTFKAGNSITFDGVMKNGIISHAYKDSAGLWQIEGKDAGVKLMKSTPSIDTLPNGNAQAVITHLTQFCDMSLDMTTDGLSGFNVRSVISGSTCAEAILELAMFSGMVAYINHDGELVIKPPRTRSYSFEHIDIIDDSGSDIDLDGYATQVLVTLNRRKWVEETDTGSEAETIYTGTTPSRRPERVTKSGLFSNGSYSITTLEPFGVLAKSETSITDNGVTINTVEEHDYDYKSKVIWRDNQEYVLFAFIERGYTLTRTTQGTYSTDKGESLTFKETTTENMSRTLSVFDATVGIPEDWLGEVDMVSSETVNRSTVREGGKAPAADMPAYSPPYDSQITRSYTRENGGKGLLCTETESTYEARQVGSIAPVKLNGQLVPHFLQGSNLAIQTHSTPQWVQIKKHREYYEQYDGDGECIFSTRSEYSDDGSEWLAAHALSSTGDTDLDEYQKAYAKFSQQSSGLDVSIGHSVIPTAWQFIELQGRTKSKVSSSDIETTALSNVSNWYNNGQYVIQSVCPHYDSSNKACNVYLLDAHSDSSPSSACSHYKGTSNWRLCSRALVALSLAREQDVSQVEAPIIGTASIQNTGLKNPAVGYQRDIYVDDILNEGQAQNIADTIAANILLVKGTKGLRKTITIPYNTGYQPDGIILEVAHNWENLQTSITYKDEGSIPDFMISQSVSGIAAFVSARDTARLNVPKYGMIAEAPENGFVNVAIGSSTIECTTKLTNLAKDDIVLVAFPAGNKVRGQVISRL